MLITATTTLVILYINFYGIEPRGYFFSAQTSPFLKFLISSKTGPETFMTEKIGDSIVPTLFRIRSNVDYNASETSTLMESFMGDGSLVDNVGDDKLEIGNNNNVNNFVPSVSNDNPSPGEGPLEKDFFNKTKLLYDSVQAIGSDIKMVRSEVRNESFVNSSKLREVPNGSSQSETASEHSLQALKEYLNQSEIFKGNSAKTYQNESSSKESNVPKIPTFLRPRESAIVASVNRTPDLLNYNSSVGKKCGQLCHMQGHCQESESGSFSCVCNYGFDGDGILDCRELFFHKERRLMKKKKIIHAVMKNLKNGHMCGLPGICQPDDICMETGPKTFVCVCNPTRTEPLKGCILSGHVTKNDTDAAKRYRHVKKEKKIQAEEIELLSPEIISELEPENSSYDETDSMDIFPTTNGFEDCRFCSTVGSECVIGPNTTLCLCFPGFAGKFCQTKISVLKRIWNDRKSLYFYGGTLGAITFTVMVVLFIILCRRKRGSSERRNSKRRSKGYRRSASSPLHKRQNSLFKPIISFQNKLRGNYERINRGEDSESLVGLRTSGSMLTLDMSSPFPVLDIDDEDYYVQSGEDYYRRKRGTKKFNEKTKEQEQEQEQRYLHRRASTSDIGSDEEVVQYIAKTRLKNMRADKVGGEEFGVRKKYKFRLELPDDPESSKVPSTGSVPHQSRSDPLNVGGTGGGGSRHEHDDRARIQGRGSIGTSGSNEYLGSNGGRTTSQIGMDLGTPQHQSTQLICTEYTRSNTSVASVNRTSNDKSLLYPISENKDKYDGGGFDEIGDIMRNVPKTRPITINFNRNSEALTPPNPMISSADTRKKGKSDL